MPHLCPKRDREAAARTERMTGKTRRGEDWTHFGHDDAIQPLLDPESPRRTSFQDEVDDDAVDRHRVHRMDDRTAAITVPVVAAAAASATACRTVLHQMQRQAKK